jgi:beta-fructofuranosidase
MITCKIINVDLKFLIHSLNRIIWILVILLFSFPINNSFGQKPKNPEYNSKVPYYEFSDDSLTQVLQLKDNSLVKRFSESRSKLSHDPYRPEYHYVNPEGRLNDPNGLSYWNGYWHLFYQAYPPEDPRQHWGHAISEDLIHWKDLPFAIYPFPERAVYSGSTWVEEDRVIAMYHGTGQGNMVAVSSDPHLLNWTKIVDGPVIPSYGSKPLDYSVFDPTIWKKGNNYYSLSGGRRNSTGTNLPRRTNDLFVSQNLTDWEYLHEFVEGDIFTQVGDDGACPYFLPIGDRYIMPFFSHMSGGQYLLGDYDTINDKFKVFAGGKFNHGSVSPSGVHAPSATSDGKGGVIILFNMNQGYPTEGWNQVMTLPRRLTINEKNELLQTPAGDIESLRDQHFTRNNIKLEANKELVIGELMGNVREIDADIKIESNSTIEINVFRDPEKEEFTRILFYRNKGTSDGLDYIRGDKTAFMPSDLLQLFEPENSPERRPRKRNSTITIDTSNSSISPLNQIRPPETAEVFIAEDENLNIRAFLDKSILEVFVNGRQCLSVRVYPEKKESIGVSFKSIGNDAEIVTLNSWTMKSIW